MSADGNHFEKSHRAMSGAVIEDWRGLRRGLREVEVVPEEDEGRSEGWLVLRRVTGFFAILAAFALGLNGLITFGLRHIKTGQYGVSNRMMAGDINAQIVINGSSRALSGFDPRIIQARTGLSAYNIGRNGSQTDMQVAVLKAYLEHNRKPQVVIQTLDSFSFVATHEVYDPAQYVPYLDDSAIWEELRKINPSIWKSRYVPLYGYVVDDMKMSWVLGLRELMGFPQREDYFLGFNPRRLEWTEEFKNFKAANPNGVDWPIESEGRESMEELARTCRAHEVKLIFVYAPEYSEMQSLTRNRSEIFADFRELSENYGVPFWDYSDWRYSGATEFFQNSQHLNERGAEVFSEDLSDRLKEFVKGNSFHRIDLEETRVRP